LRERLQRAAIVALGSRHAPTGKLATGIIERNDFHLGAAKIYPQAQQHCLRFLNLILYRVSDIVFCITV